MAGRKQERPGFSLIEIMVVTGVTSIVALGTAQMVTNLSQGQRQATQLSNLDTIEQIVEIALRDPGGCNNTLVVNNTQITAAGVRIDSGAPGGLGIRNRSNQVVLDSTGATRTVGSGGGALTVNTITFLTKNIGGVAPNNRHTDGVIRVNFNKSLPNGGTVAIDRDIQVTVIPNSAGPPRQVATCWQGVAADDATVCGQWGGGGRDNSGLCDNINLTAVVTGGNVTPKAICISGDCRTAFSGPKRCRNNWRPVGVDRTGALKCCPVGNLNCCTGTQPCPWAVGDDGTEAL